MLVVNHGEGVAGVADREEGALRRVRELGLGPRVIHDGVVPLDAGVPVSVKGVTVCIGYGGIRDQKALLKKMLLQMYVLV
jgi:hypothetical protein